MGHLAQSSRPQTNNLLKSGPALAGPAGPATPLLLEQPKMQTRGHASNIDSPPHVGYDVGDRTSSYLPANTGSRCGLGCILAREHVKCTFHSSVRTLSFFQAVAECFHQHGWWLEPSLFHSGFCLAGFSAAVHFDLNKLGKVPS